jgi:hypothetical protein
LVALKLKVDKMKQEREEREKALAAAQRIQEQLESAQKVEPAPSEQKEDPEEDLRQCSSGWIIDIS